MARPIMEIENLGKLYRLGLIGAATFRDSIGRWWRRSQPGPGRDTIWALKDVSFSVSPGEIVGIIGKNGAGKSTLLKVLSRITEPTLGKATIRGRTASLLEVGTGFHPELTGGENIYLNGAILGMRRAEIKKKFDEIVAFAEVEKFIDTPIKHYSSGMYVRLAFAVAAHLEPEILLVDEVLAVGDYEFQARCLGKMEGIRAEGRTILFVSHNLASIVNLCKRVILLNAGRMAIDSAAAEVVQHYLAAMRSIGGEAVWPEPATAPGNNIVRLHAVRVLQDGVEGPAADVDISKEIRIQIIYWNLRKGAVLYPAIWLKDRMGTFVLASSHHKSISSTQDPWYGRPHPTGLFESVCCIPANLLNEGAYSITAILGRGISDTQILQEEAVSFHVHDTGEMRKEFFGGWLGAVRPRLAWHTEYLKSIAETIGQ